MYEVTAYVAPDGGGGGVSSRRISVSSINVRVAAMPLVQPLEGSRPTVVLSLFLGHDANVALVVDGVVVEALELERLFEVRYFAPPMACGPAFEAMLSKVIEAMGVDVSNLDYISYVENGNRCVRDFFEGVPFVFVDHHRSHAVLGVYDSPFERPIVMSFDGGGNDGNWHIYNATKRRGGGGATLDVVCSYEWNFGSNYAKIGAVLPEVVGSLDEFNARCTAAHESLGVYRCVLALAGKIMGYAALGAVRSEWLPAARTFMRTAEATIRVLPWGLEGVNHVYLARDRANESWRRGLEPEDVWRFFPSEDSDQNTSTRERDLAATIQRAFELEVVAALADEPNDVVRGLYDGDYDGIVLVGGCALNVLANSAIERRFSTRVHVPSAPNDGGLAVGAAWHVVAPSSRQPLQYAGPELFDRADIAALVEPWVANGTLRVRPATVDDVARSLASDDGVVGVARGRAEFGPRALGHRSLLAYPRSLESKDTLNVVKFREWWRPVAPIVAVEDALRVFDTLPRAPFMSFAPRLTAEAAAALPAIVHYDGTARPQLVSQKDDAWVHALLMAVRELTGWGVLINTSFNVRGKPILNRASEAIDLLLSSKGMTAIVLEDLFIERNDRAVRVATL